MATVELREVEKRYRGAKSAAVKRVSLSIADGELVTLVGPSGCGKSTTLNLIAGLEQPTSGSVLIDGVDVNTLSPKERDVAMVFQSYALYPHLDVKGNLGFPLKVAGLEKTELAKRVQETAAMLGLETLLDRRPAQLSGGQRQRVALGRALVRRPKVFLFDEPLSNLDAALRAEMRAEIKRLHHRLRATFIYVTHDQAEAMTLSDRVVVMNAGEVEQVAGPKDIYERPTSLFVARFFGTPRINVVPPEVLGLEPNKALSAVRAEHLELTNDPASPKQTKARIALIEPMGAESWVTTEVGEHTLIARVAPDFDGKVGDEVGVRVSDPSKVLAFDAPPDVVRAKTSAN